MRRRRALAFTLIELIVVMAVIGTLATLALPRFIGSVDRAKATTLKHSLATMRDAIDKFNADVGRYPESLEELVTRRYLRAVPADPITESTTTWVIVPPPDGGANAAVARDARGSVWDVQSGAEGAGPDGKPWREL